MEIHRIPQGLICLQGMAFKRDLTLVHSIIPGQLLIQQVYHLVTVVFSIKRKTILLQPQNIKLPSCGTESINLKNTNGIWMANLCIGTLKMNFIYGRQVHLSRHWPDILALVKRLEY